MLIDYACIYRRQCIVLTHRKVPAAKIAANQARQGLIEELINDMILAFTPEERRYFYEEFNFFELITRISGVLKVGVCCIC